MAQKVGIWIDKRKAVIITTEGGGKIIKTIKSDVEEFNPAGGSGTRMKGGPQDVVQDSRYTEREKHQLNEYFESIAEALSDVDQLVIFGPAQTGHKLGTHLSEHNRKLHGILRSIEKADSMTDAQLVEWVRQYYK